MENEAKVKTGEFPDFLVNSVFHERLVGEVGHPSRLSRKGGPNLVDR
jgi:hypothetical protein